MQKEEKWFKWVTGLVLVTMGGRNGTDPGTGRSGSGYAGRQDQGLLSLYPCGFICGFPKRNLGFGETWYENKPDELEGLLQIEIL